MKSIIIFASGAGSNAQNIMRYFEGSSSVKVLAVLTNNPTAGVIAMAQSFGVETIVFSKEQLNNGFVANRVKELQPSLIVLAGFLLKFPDDIIKDFPGRIINIHPALLPRYGGKGMYGMHVHRAVCESCEAETGITIHYVDGHYDKGDIIFQKSVSLDGNETPETISKLVQKLEHEYFPGVIENVLNKQV
jgi:phosphoribosylglycinamide formyltransferase-1